MLLELSPTPTGQELEIRERARAVANSFQQTVLSNDQAGIFHRSHFDAVAAARLQSVSTAKEFGGLGYSFLAHISGIEELARSNLSLAVTTGVTNLAQGALFHYGTQDQKQNWLVPLATGKLLGAFALSEPGSGSDAAALRLSAKKVGSDYLFQGTKCWCSSVGHADLYLVFARTGIDKNEGISAFLIPKDLPGFHMGKLEEKMGLRTSALGELVFDNCKVPAAFRIGEEGEGFGIALSQLASGRIVIGAASLGLALGSMELALLHRRTTKSTAAEHPDGMDGVIARHFASLQAAKSLLREAATAKDLSLPIKIIAAQAKLFCTNLAMQVATDMLQCFGMEGSLPQYEVERHFRDAKCLQIVEGTNQIQELILINHLTRQIS